MRLIKRNGDGTLSLTKEIHDETKIPEYAILSHTWAEDPEEEVSFNDFNTYNEDVLQHKPGWGKLRLFAAKAAREGLTHFWVDTCCIDKDKSSILQEALTSMFRWYQRAKMCYVYLSDVSIPRYHGYRVAEGLWVRAFWDSRWFRRGWTLQELLAPEKLEFFSAEWRLIGSKETLMPMLAAITKIPVPALLGRTDLANFSIEERFEWASSRQTRRGEDQAYSLLGIFGVSIPVMYGEGKASAMRHLRNEIRDVAEAEAVSPTKAPDHGKPLSQPISPQDSSAPQVQPAASETPDTSADHIIDPTWSDTHDKQGVAYSENTTEDLRQYMDVRDYIARARAEAATSQHALRSSSPDNTQGNLRDYMARAREEAARGQSARRISSPDVSNIFPADPPPPSPRSLSPPSSTGADIRGARAKSADDGDFSSENWLHTRVQDRSRLQNWISQQSSSPSVKDVKKKETQGRQYYTNSERQRAGVQKQNHDNLRPFAPRYF